MPRKPRIEIPGYYHVLNRGVERRTVFVEPEDYEHFIELMCSYAREFGIRIHNYCLMSNHYHLLLEINRPVLSKYMRQLGMNYAIYFNKKYRRSGHLWQGRYRSWYVTDEAYLYALMRYIEHNPLQAKLVKNPQEYPYSSLHAFLDPSRLPSCLQHSRILQDYGNNVQAIKALLSEPVDADQLKELKKSSATVEAPEEDKPDEASLKRLFDNVDEIKERNRRILQAYEQGYSQHRIAKVLGLTQPTVHGIVKRMKKKRAIPIT